ncbi:MAG: DUF2610 domain-containing protein [Gammaproteobacteria bacterium]|nr:DUF2610 domain-containing protein [Gammaproteobacteria bacterium]
MYSSSGIPAPEQAEGSWFGIRIGNHTPELGDKAVKVLAVHGQGPLAGKLSEGALVYRLGDKRTETIYDIVAASATIPPGSQTSLEVLNAGALQRSTLSLSTRGIPMKYTVPLICPPDMQDPPKTDTIFTIEPPAGSAIVPIDLELAFLRAGSGCTLAPEVADSFRKLYALAKENKVNYVDLVRYALDSAQKDKAEPPKPPAPSEADLKQALTKCRESGSLRQDEIIAACTQAIEHAAATGLDKAEWSKLHLRRGEAHAAQGKLKEAKADYQKVIELATDAETMRDARRRLFMLETGPTPNPAAKPAPPPKPAVPSQPPAAAPQGVAKTDDRVQVCGNWKRSTTSSGFRLAPTDMQVNYDPAYGFDRDDRGNVRGEEILRSTLALFVKTSARERPSLYLRFPPFAIGATLFIHGGWQVRAQIEIEGREIVALEALTVASPRDGANVTNLSIIDLQRDPWERLQAAMTASGVQQATIRIGAVVAGQQHWPIRVTTPLAGFADCAGPAVAHLTDAHWNPPPPKPVNYTRDDKPDSWSERQTECQNGNAQACYHVGQVYQIADSGPMARQFYAKACDAGHAGGCLNPGTMHYEGEGGPVNKYEARILVEKACDKGEASGCFNLGLSHGMGEGGPVDKRQARRFYAKACDKGDAGGSSISGLCTTRAKAGRWTNARRGSSTPRPATRVMPMAALISGTCTTRARAGR